MTPTEPNSLTLGDAMPPGTGVCVINLDQRTDRWAAFEQEIQPHLSPLSVHRISATSGVSIPGYGQRPWFRGRKRDRTWAARGGCTLSHRQALLHARSSGWSHVLILEDDVTPPVVPQTAFLRNLQDALCTHLFDVCYLGFTDPVAPFRRLCDLGETHSCHRIFGASTTHAYLVNQTAIDWILARLPNEAAVWKWLTRHRAIDRFYARNLSPDLAVIAISPSLLGQEAGLSDITGRAMESHEGIHVTRIPLVEVSENAHHDGLHHMAARFTRQSQLDKLRACWKVLNGF